MAANGGTTDGNVSGNNGNSVERDNGNSRTPDSASAFIVNPSDLRGPATGRASSATDNTATGSTGRRRGRPPGSGSTGATGKAKETVYLAKEPLRDLILMAHSLLHAASKIPELELGKDEADQLAQASVNVMRHYDVGAQSQKAIDWIAFVGAVGLVYGSRAFAYRVRTGQQRKAPILRTVP